MTDYTLPPIDLRLSTWTKELLRKHGQQCAAAARAPLLARLREVCQTLVAVIGADGPCDAEDAAEKAASRIDALQNLLERKKARIAELEAQLQLERHSLLWACNVYMVADEAEGADRAQRAVAAASRVRESVRKSLDLHKKKESGDA